MTPQPDFTRADFLKLLGSMAAAAGLVYARELMEDELPPPTRTTTNSQDVPDKPVADRVDRKTEQILNEIQTERGIYIYQELLIPDMTLNMKGPQKIQSNREMQS